MQRHEKAAFAVAAVFLDQHLLVAKIAHAGAAVFRIRPHEQVSLLAGLAERLAIDKALLTPALPLRPDLVLKEAPRRFAELVVLGLEDGSFHGK